MLVSPSQADTSPEHPVPGEEAPPAETRRSQSTALGSAGPGENRAGGCMNLIPNHSKGGRCTPRTTLQGVVATAKSSNKGLPGEAAHSVLERRAQLSRG